MSARIAKYTKRGNSALSFDTERRPSFPGPQPVRSPLRDGLFFVRARARPSRPTGLRELPAVTGTICYLSPVHPRGRHKARVFASALGLTPATRTLRSRCERVSCCACTSNRATRRRKQAGEHAADQADPIADPHCPTPIAPSASTCVCNRGSFEKVSARWIYAIFMIEGPIVVGALAWALSRFGHHHKSRRNREA